MYFGQGNPIVRYVYSLKNNWVFNLSDYEIRGGACRARLRNVRSYTVPKAVWKIF
jgi:hypothetical protein